MARKKESKTKKILKTFLFLLCISFVAWGTYSIGKLIIKPTNMFIVNNGEIYKAETALGYIIRDEKIIPSDESKEIIQIKTEGEKVAKDDVVFRYHTTDEDSINNQIQELTKKIQEALEGQTDLFSSDIKAIEGQIEAKLEDINKKNNIQSIKEYKNDISTYITKKAKIAGSLSTSETYINSLISEKENLEDELNKRSEHIYAPESGIVSYRIDNLEETLSTKDFTYLSSKFLKDLDIKTGQVIGTSNNKAKIINNYKCYIATVLKSEEAQNVKINKTIKLKLSNNSIIYAKIIYKNQEDNNKTIIVFEINDDVDKLSDIRKISMDVIWWETKGLKVPKSAIYYDNGLAYVSRSRAGYTEKILVKILEENGGYCIVDNYSTDELKNINFNADDIKSYKKINIYDEILAEPNK